MKSVIIGYGSIGKRHYQNLYSKFKIQSLVCTKKNIVHNNKKQIQHFSSIEKCLRTKPEIGFITNVTSAHVKTATQLANSGCNIFIEKPLSNSFNGIKNLLNVIKQKKIITLMGCVMRFHPCIEKIKKLIDDGKIGRIIYARSENGTFLPYWHPYEDYRQSYASRKELGGGVVLTCIHEIDYLYWFFGNVKEVFAITGKFSDLDINVDDLSSILLRFKNNVVAEVHLDFFQRPNFRSCKVVGTKGTIYWDSDRNSVQVYDNKKKKWIEKLKLKKYNINEMYVDELNHFIKCVKEKKKTINDIFDGVKVQKIALAILQASKTKKMVQVK